MSWWEAKIAEQAQLVREATDATENESLAVARVILNQGWASMGAAGRDLIEHVLAGLRGATKCA